MIIIAASGMAESGRILHHLAHGASNPNNTILVVGFMAEHTLGRRIVERRPQVKVFGEEVPLRARVEVVDGYSAHAGRSELLAWIAAVREFTPALTRVFLVHGEAGPRSSFAALLATRGFDPHSPVPGERHDV